MRSIIDLHNHVVPGVDDGASDLDQSRAALAALVGEGVQSLIATPHLDGSLTRRPEALAERLAELDAGWARLAELARAEFPDLAVHRGAELRLDLPDPDLSDARVRLDGGGFILVEFPYMAVPPRSAPALEGLRSAGCTPIVAHPERYDGLDPELRVVESWRRSGAFLQVNAGSFLGRYGSQARATALRLLERGWIDCVASDYHARGRPGLAAFRDALAELGAAEQAAMLTEVNPSRVLVGEPPVAVPPLRRSGTIWNRIAAIFR